MILVFDLDGTLLDTLDDLWASVNHALAHFSLPLRSKDEVRRFLGNGVQVLMQKAIGEETADTHKGGHEGAPAFADVLAVFRSHYLRHSLDRTQPYPGINNLLRTCKSRGYHTAIVSNKPDAAVQELRQRFFADTIDLAIGEQQPAIRRKPAPDMVHAALSLLRGDEKTRRQEDRNTRRREDGNKRRREDEPVYYIGDSEVDIQTARNADIPCIAVSWGFRDRSFLAAQGYAQAIIDTPAQLLDIISG